MEEEKINLCSKILYNLNAKINSKYKNSLKMCQPPV